MKMKIFYTICYKVKPYVIQTITAVIVAIAVVNPNLVKAQSAPPIITGDPTTCENETKWVIISCSTTGTVPWCQGCDGSQFQHQLPFPPYTTRPDNSSGYYIFGGTTGVYSATFTCATANPVYTNPSEKVPLTVYVGTTNPNNPQISTTYKSVSAGQSLTLTSSCSTSITWSTGEHTPNIVVTPSKTTSYSVTCPVSSTRSGCMIIAKYQVDVAQSIQHFHQLATNADFSQRKLLASIPGASTFKVCADGSLASIFKFAGGSLDYNRATLSVPDDINKYGGFSIIAQNSDSLVVRYKHPTRVNADAALFVFTATLSAPSAQPVQFSIEVKRAPVVMIHGLWSDKESFQEFENQLLQTGFYSYDYLKRVDYSQTNNLHFSSNIIEVPQAISQVIASLKANNIAAGAADVIGHSMGGILSRLYLQSIDYRSDIHKLITVNTPHSGSQIANFLLDVTNQPANDAFCGATLRRLLSNNTLCNAGAIDDLRVNSKAIDSDLNGAGLNRNKVPSHSIVTAEYATLSEVDNSFSLKDRTFCIGWILDAFGSFGANQIFYPETENDLIVSLLSQKGGLTGACTSYINNQLHIGSPANLQVRSILQTLLGADAGGSSFCLGFSPAAIDYNPQPTTLAPPNKSSQTTTTATLTITSPLKGKYYSLSSSVPIAASGSGITEIRTIVRYNYDSIYVAKKVGSEVNYTAQAGSYIGRREVIVFGKTSSGQSISDTSYFYVQPNLCQSTKIGDWEDGTTWTCGHSPSVNDWAIIGQSHTVTINSSSATVRKIIYEGGKIRFASPNSKLFVYSPPN